MLGPHEKRLNTTNGLIMIPLIMGLVTSIPGVATAFFDWQAKKMNTELEGFRVGATVDHESYKAWLDAAVETNRMKLAQNSWWGARMIILTAGWPCALHLAAVMLDSFPFWIPLFMSEAHQVGAWGVPKPPAPYDDYQAKIVLSFFIIMPAMPIAQAAATWLARK